jgi:hypothetical protein
MEASGGGDRPTPNPSPQERGGEFAASFPENAFRYSEFVLVCNFANRQLAEPDAMNAPAASYSTSTPVGLCELRQLKCLESDLDLLQPIEIAQNGQNIVWKSLALEPHFFGIVWQKFGAARVP